MNPTIEQIFEHFNSEKPLWLSVDGENWKRIIKEPWSSLSYGSEGKWKDSRCDNYYSHVSLTNPNTVPMTREEMIVACYEMAHIHGPRFMIKEGKGHWKNNWADFLFSPDKLKYYKYTTDGGITAHRFEKPKGEE